MDNEKRSRIATNELAEMLNVYEAALLRIAVAFGKAAPGPCAAAVGDAAGFFETQIGAATRHSVALHHAAHIGDRLREVARVAKREERLVLVRESQPKKIVDKIDRSTMKKVERHTIHLPEQFDD